MSTPISQIKPQYFNDYLDEYVVGQDQTKRHLSYAFAMHFYSVLSRINKKKEDPGHTPKHYKKPKVLLMGPTGCGKTYMIEKLCKATKLPLTIIEGLDIAAPGWEGTSLKKHLARGYDENKHKLDRPDDFENGVVFIDEIDKICIPAFSSKGTDHNKTIQNSLLRQVEGTVVNLAVGFDVDTSNMLFIFAGNFQSIREEREKNNKVPVGFGGARKVIAPSLDKYHKELITAGMVPELAGRISMVSELAPLSDKELKKALNIEGGPVDQYKELLRVTGMDLTISNKDAKFIIEHCRKGQIGARGLQTGLDIVVEKKLRRYKPCQESNENTTSSNTSGDYYGQDS